MGQGWGEFSTGAKGGDKWWMRIYRTAESLGGLGHEELAPPARTDRILHQLARSRRHELDAVRALLPVIWMVLIFGGFMGDCVVLRGCRDRAHFLRILVHYFAMREPEILRHGVRRDDGPCADQRYALQQRTGDKRLYVYRSWMNLSCRASPYETHVWREKNLLLHRKVPGTTHCSGAVQVSSGHASAPLNVPDPGDNMTSVLAAPNS